jgi:CBS-domain-containing membrane protein
MDSNGKEPGMRAATDDLNVADLMTLDPVTVSVDASIDEAENLLRNHRIAGLPVVDADGILVGVIGHTDLLHLPRHGVRGLIPHRDRGIRVGDLMSTPPVTIDSGASLREAALLMNDKRLHRLVVVDAHGRPIGVIAAMDFVSLADALAIQIERVFDEVGGALEAE